MIYLIRYSEIALKGKNRKDFENQLIKNIKAFLKAKGLKAEIKSLPGRLLLEAEQEANVKPVFGISSYSPCTKIKADLKTLCSEALKLAKNHSKTTRFRISARRSTKSFPLSSLELNSKMGAFIVEKAGLKVDLENPDLDIGIEIIGKEAFVFEKTIDCFGGLPVGVEGKALVLIDEKAPNPSFLAALLMMRRGCAIEIAGLSSLNYSLIQTYSPRLLAFHRIKKLSDLKELADKLDCKAVVVDETLQTLKDEARPYPLNTMILRPLIVFSDEEINNELEKYKALF